MNDVMEEPLTSVAVHRRRDALAGVLIGTAVGDALGLPTEGLSARRQRKLFALPLRHRFLGRYGMVSDDTEHTFMVGQSLLEAGDDLPDFRRCLAWRMRWWLVALPAGVGFATLRAILKLWIGFPPVRSGVISAGNGPAMRSALLGVYYAGDPERRHEFVRASTEMTHRDVRAEIAAQAVAEVAAWMSRRAEDFGTLWETLAALSSLPAWLDIVAVVREGFVSQLPVGELARKLGAEDGVSGYALQSVPVAIYAALLHRDDYEKAVTAAVICGGDTDTVGAITGALVGARLGVEGIPEAWRRGIVEYPRSLVVLDRVATALDRQGGKQTTLGAVRWFWPVAPLRNLVFLAAVLVHAVRRLLPPY